jgi:hypothetical protein
MQESMKKKISQECIEKGDKINPKRYAEIKKLPVYAGSFFFTKKSLEILSIA